MEISKEIGSKYRFIVLAGLRVAQLQKGAIPRVDLGENAKMTAIAIREILEKKVNFHQSGHLAYKLSGAHSTL